MARKNKKHSTNNANNVPEESKENLQLKSQNDIQLNNEVKQDLSAQAETLITETVSTEESKSNICELTTTSKQNLILIETKQKIEINQRNEKEKIEDKENNFVSELKNQAKEAQESTSNQVESIDEAKSVSSRKNSEAGSLHNSLRKQKSLKRDSVFKLIDLNESVYRPEFIIKHEKNSNEKLWSLMETYRARDKISIQKSIISHIEYTLARTRFDLNNQVVYQGVSLSVRDHLLEAWNDSQINIKINDPKRIYYLSIEFLLGRLLQNALINLNLEDKYKEPLLELGYKLEDIYENENDPALGNGGLGRLAACYLDSLTSQNYPGWGYGIRYDYGIFRQAIENNEQREYPDYWLTKGNPWEIMRTDVRYKVRFGGYCKDEWKNGRKTRIWEGGQEVDAVAFDTVQPGWDTFNCNTLRLWKSFPSQEFNFESFNKGDYASALEERDQANYITSVLYPNDNTYAGKELRLKQQYFFCAATINDIIRRFLRSNLPWSEFPAKNAIQLNDTHPTISIIELLRQLIDEYQLEYREAFEIVRKTFAYTNHTVLPEALEKWSVELIGKLLPRHMELIYLINHFFMEEVGKRFPGNWDKMSTLSIIEESQPKLVRMANLCIICSHTVNGVAEIHSQLIRTHLFKDFNEFYPGKFINVTNGVTPRRWIHCAFRELSDLITEYYGNQDWLAELSLLDELPSKLDRNGQLPEFLSRLKAAKISAKKRLANWVKENCKVEIDHENFFFDVMVKRIHEYKRQFMNALYCVHRYLTIKSLPFHEKEKVVKRVTFFGGKAAPGYLQAKNTIKLINLIANYVNNDNETNRYFKMVYLPDYKVSTAQLIIPGADLSQHISTAGTEASGTSCMKFAMTGSLIIGTKDGANIEIAEEIGEENIFFFGKDVKEVEKIRNSQRQGAKPEIGSRLKKVFEFILSGKIGDCNFMRDYIDNIINGNDFYLVASDFYSYLEAQEKVDNCYMDEKAWEYKCFKSICKMGFFSSDRSIQNYAENIWNIKPIEMPKPSSDASKRVVSSTNLKLCQDGSLSNKN